MGVFIAFLLVAPVQAIIGGFTIEKLWGWFVSGNFHQVPAISLPEAIGLSILITLFTYHTSPDDDRSTGETLAIGLVMAIFMCAYALIFGFIVHQFQ